MYSFLFNGVDNIAPYTPAYIFQIACHIFTPLSKCWVPSWFVFLSSVFISSLHGECICSGDFVCVPDIFLYNCIKAFCFLYTTDYHCLGSLGLHFLLRLAHFHYVCYCFHHNLLALSDNFHKHFLII